MKGGGGGGRRLTSHAHTHRNTHTPTPIVHLTDPTKTPQPKTKQYLHALAYPPQWELQRDLAERYAGLGVVASAADLYEALGMWDEVVECYKVLVGGWVICCLTGKRRGACFLKKNQKKNNI